MKHCTRLVQPAFDRRKTLRVYTRFPARIDALDQRENIAFERFDRGEWNCTHQRSDDLVQALLCMHRRLDRRCRLLPHRFNLRCQVA